MNPFKKKSRTLGRPFIMIGIVFILLSVFLCMILLTTFNISIPVALGVGLGLVFIGAVLCLVGVCFYRFGSRRRFPRQVVAIESSATVTRVDSHRDTSERTSVTYSHYAGHIQIGDYGPVVPAVEVMQPPSYSTLPRQEEQPPSYSEATGAALP